MHGTCTQCIILSKQHLDEKVLFCIRLFLYVRVKGHSDHHSLRTGRMQNLTVKGIECGLFLDEKAASFDLRDANGIQRRTVCVCNATKAGHSPATTHSPSRLRPFSDCMFVVRWWL